MPNLLPDELLNIDYYFNHMSMFLKESYGIKDRFYKIYFATLTEVNRIGSRFLELMHDFVLENKFDKLVEINEFKDNYIPVPEDQLNDYELYHYFEKVNDKYVLTDDTELEDKTYYKVSCPLVEQLSSLAGINRETKLHIEKEGETPYDKLVILTSYEMIILSRFKFFELNYDGTYEGLLKCYNDILDRLDIRYITTDKLTVTVFILFKYLNTEYAPNLEEVLMDQDFLIKSLGIQYNISHLKDLSDLFTFRENIGYEVVLSPEGNPQENGYYEFVDNIMKLSKDTSVDPNKTYYLPKEKFQVVADPKESDFDKYYVKDGDNYIPATGEFDPSETYYTIDYHDYLDDDNSLML